MDNHKKTGKKGEPKIAPRIDNDQLGENVYNEFRELKDQQNKGKGK